MRRRSFIAGTAALACGRPGGAPRFAFSETRETVAALVEAWREKMPVVGLSLALVDRGELAWATGFGMADREAHRPAGADTVYAIGSLTKLYTALTALRADATAALDLDTPLQRHLPQLRTPGVDAIRLRHLLCHRSGLISDWHRGSLGERPPDWRLVADEIADEPLIAAPDSWYAYSNVGYTLMGHVLDNMSPKPFTEHTLDVARDTAGASALRFDPPPLMAASYCAGRREVEPRLRLQPAAGMYGSVLDLVPLLRWLLAGDGLAAAMLTAQPAGPLDCDERWGLGLALKHVGLAHAGRVGWHTGRTFAHRAVLFVLPDRGLGIAVLANFREAGGVEDLAVDALQTALLERDGLDLPPSLGDGETRPRAAFDPAALQRHVGRYANDFDVVRLEIEHGGLVSRAELGKTALIPAPGGGFHSADNRDSHVAITDRAGYHILTSTVRGIETRIGVRCPEGPVPEDWLRRVGRYRVDAAPGEVVAFKAAHLEHVGGGLELRLELPQAFATSSTLARFALAPSGPHEATIFGIGRGKGQRVAAEDGPDGPALSWAGYRLLRSDA
ncbi:serine hydrolase domain-containing protein [Nannocystis radixulma]|uniref:Serine hydrolase n=1 Tax=Nannocystis radixulma TaxID=2995305 RepID=A0ABT5BKW8_9BACT|nr:serine hydrolase domain-containing protein [Nannocystis radixulma]MDC0673672.1 serine hydrolase [Nannocystis radixulma]